jgi:hypothetical protein
MARQSLELARLFYTVEADTKGFKRDLDDAQRSAIRFTDFILAHPVVAAGALGAALIGVGIKATAMAAETDQAVRRIAAVLPDAIGKFEELKQAVDAIAKSSGISEEALLTTAQALAGSSKDLPDLLQRLKAVQIAADATGLDMGTLADQLTRVLHIFDLNGDQIENVAAKLKAAAQGKISLEDLLDSFRTAAPALRAANVDFDTGAAALAKLVGEGLNAKGVASALKALAEQGGQAVRDFVGPVQDGAEALKKFHAAADLVADGAQRNGDKIRENLNATMRQLGDELLPVVNSGLKLANFLLEQMATTVTRIPDRIPFSELIARGLTSGPATIGAGGGGVFPSRGGPQPVAEITAFADPAAIKARADFAKETERVLKSLSDGLKGAAVTALDDFLAEYRKVAGTLTAEQQQAAEQAIAALRAKIADAATALQINQAGGLGPEQARDRLSGLRQGLVDQLGPDEASAKNLALRQQILAIDNAVALVNQELVGFYQAQADRSGEVLDNTFGVEDATATAAAKQRDLSRAMEQTARGGIGLAQALGLAGAASAAVLQNVVSLAGALPDAIKGIEAIQQGGKALSDAGGLAGALGPIIGVAGGLAGLIAGLTAEDPNVKLLRDEEVKLRVALDNLATHFDSFASNLTGQEQIKAQGAVSELLSGRRLQGDAGFHGLGSFLSGGSANGLNLADLQKVAKETLGFELDTSNIERFTAGLKALQTALQETDRVRFLDSFTGQLEALNARFQLLNITDPVEKLKELLAILTDVPRRVKITNPDGSTQFVDVGHGSPAIANALAGLDLGNAGDRAKAQDKLDELLKELTNGQIDAAGRGGLDPEQFKQELLDLGSLLRDANTQVGGQSQSFAIDRTITEITGSRIAAILDTALIYQSALPEIRDLLSAALKVGLVTPPPVPAPVPVATGPSIIVQSLQVNVIAPVGTSPEAIGQAVGAAAIDQLLAQRAGLKVATAGGVLR